MLGQSTEKTLYTRMSNLCRAGNFDELHVMFERAKTTQDLDLTADCCLQIIKNATYFFLCAERILGCNITPVDNPNKIPQPQTESHCVKKAGKLLQETDMKLSDAILPFVWSVYQYMLEKNLLTPTIQVDIIYTMQQLNQLENVAEYCYRQALARKQISKELCIAMITCYENTTGLSAVRLAMKDAFLLGFVDMELCAAWCRIERKHGNYDVAKKIYDYLVNQNFRGELKLDSQVLQKDCSPVPFQVIDILLGKLSLPSQHRVPDANDAVSIGCAFSDYVHSIVLFPVNDFFPSHDETSAVIDIYRQAMATILKDSVIPTPSATGFFSRSALSTQDSFETLRHEIALIFH